MFNAFSKYRIGISDDPIRNACLRSLNAVRNDSIGRMTFKMATDEQMRNILDDEDYDFWITKKKEHLERV